MSSPQTTASDLAAVVDAIRGHDRFTLTTHENPDGDALGSLLAAKLAFDQLGKDSIMVLHTDAPLPGEYGFMPLAELRRRWPDDVSERVLVALDCANESRIGDQDVLGRVPLTLDIDHHHDNTRFGDINLIVPDASSTGEVLRDLFRERAVEGADMAVLIREPPRAGGPTRRVSLRASVDELDVSAIARKSGGGGHRQAAGFSSEASIEDITEFVRREFAAARS